MSTRHSTEQGYKYVDVYLHSPKFLIEQCLINRMDGFTPTFIWYLSADWSVVVCSDAVRTAWPVCGAPNENKTGLL